MLDLKNLAKSLARLPSGLTTRFAPAPTGYLHLGHALSAAFVWGVAAVTRAKVLLRIEDHDRIRSKAEFERAILEDLAWLGFESEDLRSPTGTSFLRQSDTDETYLRFFQELQRQGCVYGCRCSRKEVIASMPDHAPGRELRYSGVCRSLQLSDAGIGQRVILEDSEYKFEDLLLGEQIQRPAGQCGDLLLRDRAGNWTYQFAVVVDDFVQNVGLVIRGQDLTHCCGRQLQLAGMLGRRDLPYFLHHPLLREEDGAKLGKRIQSASIRALRAEGWSPSEVLGEALFLGGLIEERRAFSVEQLHELFS